MFYKLIGTSNGIGKSLYKFLYDDNYILYNTNNKLEVIYYLILCYVGTYWVWT